MAGQHAEIALGARNLHLVHLLVDQQAIGRDDLQLQMRWDRRDGHRLVPYAACRLRNFSSTSSIVPAM